MGKKFSGNSFLLFLVPLVFLCLSLSLPSSVVAFEEEFSSWPLDSSVWQVYTNNGSIVVNNGKIELSAGNTTSFPFLYSKIEAIPAYENFTVKLRIKFNNATSKGTGVVLSTVIPPNNINDTPLSSPLFSQRHFLEIWQSSPMGYYFSYSGDCFNQGCQMEEVVVHQEIANLNYRDIEFQYLGNRYSIFLDGAPVFVSNETSVRPKYIWFGNYTSQGLGETWTGFEIDYIRIAPLPSSPILLLPGMGACWDGAVVKGGEGDNWRLWPPGRMAYQGFIDSFNNAGLQENQDWYLFCYDWRKSLEENAQKLNEFIEANIDPPSQVSFVGHSMGGLVSRIYAQLYPNKVDRLITLGSPHEGAVRVYPLWEGGQIWEYDGIAKLYFKTLLRVNKEDGEHPMHTVRRVVPSLQDLLPTFNFLKDPAGVIFKNIGTHNQQNETLNSYAPIPSTTRDRMSVIYGSGLSTLEAIKVTSITSPHANWAHQALGLWEDGEPTHSCTGTLCEYTDHGKDYSESMLYTSLGDQTVLASSAKVSGVDFYELPLDHGSLAGDSTSIQKVFDILGISQEPASSNGLIEKAIAFLIRSPAKITVSAPDGKSAGFGTPQEIENSFYDDEANFLLVLNPAEGDYQITITGTGGGHYNLLTAYLDENNDVGFTEHQFKTEEGKIDEFLFNTQQQALEDPYGSVSLKSAQTVLKELWKGLDKKTYKKCGFKKAWQLTKKAEKKARKKPEQACELIEDAYNPLTQCFEKLNQEASLKLSPEIELINQNLSDAYQACSANGGIKLDRSEISQSLSEKEDSLNLINNNLQQASNNGEEIPAYQAILFTKAVTLFNEAQEAISQNSLAKARLLSFRIDFFLSKLGN